ncbi:hypothetical protein ACROYT_G033178 [Oculina patagonica]
MVDNCTSSPCQNSGTCSRHPGGYNCTCPADFYGDNCEIIDNCTSSPCQNSGTCARYPGGYNCTCAPGFYGDNCEIIDNCTSSPCRNNGTCTRIPGGYSCMCWLEFYGDNCQIPVPVVARHYSSSRSQLTEVSFGWKSVQVAHQFKRSFYAYASQY